MDSIDIDIFNPSSIGYHYLIIEIKEHWNYKYNLYCLYPKEYKELIPIFERLSFKDKGIAKNNIIIYDTETGKITRRSFECPDWLTFNDDNIEECKEKRCQYNCFRLQGNKRQFKFSEYGRN